MDKTWDVAVLVGSLRRDSLNDAQTSA